MASVENHLIELLPRSDRKRLLAACDPVQLVLSEVLASPANRPELLTLKDQRSLRLTP